MKVKVPSAENPKTSVRFSFKPGVGHNTALHASLTAINSHISTVHFQIFVCMHVLVVVRGLVHVGDKG